VEVAWAIAPEVLERATGREETALEGVTFRAAVAATGTPSAAETRASTGEAPEPGAAEARRAWDLEVAEEASAAVAVVAEVVEGGAGERS
jgi:hypothetical protein